MQHLTIEALARLVDEPANEEERLHLSMCGECRHELGELEAQVAEMGELGTLAAPGGGWASLAARLRSEGMMGSRSDGRAGAAGLRRGALLRMAAALALFVAGGLTGEILRGGAVDRAEVRLASEATTPEEAEQVLMASEAEYVAALTRYAELTGENITDDPVNRLAALEGIVLTTRAALREAPADPVINGYHLAAVTQREALLRQISNQEGERWF